MHAAHLTTARSAIAVLAVAALCLMPAAALAQDGGGLPIVKAPVVEPEPHPVPGPQDITLPDGGGVAPGPQDFTAPEGGGGPQPGPQDFTNGNGGGGSGDDGIDPAGEADPASGTDSDADNGLGDANAIDSSELHAVPSAGTAVSADGELPYTGGESWFVAAMGVLMLIAGFGARRLARSGDIA